MSTKKFITVNDYISELPSGKRSIFQKLRKTIKLTAPDCEELISYNIPSVKFKGSQLWYACWKDHISIYPASRAMEAAVKGLSVYRASKGTLKFPLDKPLPVELIRKIVKFKTKENYSSKNSDR